MKKYPKLVSIAAILLIVVVLIFSKQSDKIKPAQESLGFHYGINQTTEFFDQAYQGASAAKPQDKIAAITVNHHLLAPQLIAKEFNLVATDKPITVVLLSPNHFYRGSGGVISSQYDWQTPFGTLKTNRNLVTKLEQTGLVNVDESPFTDEHGINGIVGFIKKSLPNATFVPLIIKEDFPNNRVDALAAKLKEILPADTLVVGSFDFSHYLTSNGAEFHDIQTLSTIDNFDYNRILKLDIDSHAGLRLFLGYLDLTGNKKFTVTSHENSSTVTGNYNFIETTSYINGYFTKGGIAHNNQHTALYVQGINPEDHWKPDASERLYKFNDEVLSEKPKELDSVNLGTQPIAVGIAYDNLVVTDIYLFPLKITNHLITLQPQPQPGTMHLQIK